jgi:heparinase II/III-like protein/uncharacterized protein DUF4962
MSPIGAAGVPFGHPSKKALRPSPADGAEVRITPPPLCFGRAPGAATYAVEVRREDGSEQYSRAGLVDPIHLPDIVFPPGRYRWTVEAFDAGARSIGRREWWRFTIPRGVPELPWESPQVLLARVPAARPRFLFRRPELDRLRGELTSKYEREWGALRAMIDSALEAAELGPPRYAGWEEMGAPTTEQAQYNEQFRRSIELPLAVLSFAYHLTGERGWGERAKKLLLELEAWGTAGPMSLERGYRDEPALRSARQCHRAYDWLHPLLDEGEERRVRAMVTARGAQISARLRRIDFHARPGDSHNGRLIAYLAEYAIVLAHECRQSADWLDYSLRALATFYPHWGDEDGGWAEGASYAVEYNAIYLGALECLRRLSFDLYRRPFFARLRRFFLHCVSPIGEMRPFGDGAERGGVGSSGALLMRHHASVYRDPEARWWSDQIGIGPAPFVDPFMPFLVDPAAVAAKPPPERASAELFRGIGWAALHSDLARPERDTMVLFKSSPFGSISHSHADQNGFAVLKGGRALAIPSGYYGPSYGMPHHRDWTQQTRASNCVLVGGRGQPAQDQNARGEIVAFSHFGALSYVSGDATEAYAGRLRGYRRHLLFLRPGAILVLDDLAGASPSRFQWLIHALEEIRLDAEPSRFEIRRKGASLTGRLWSSAGGVAISRSDAFDPPFEAGLLGEHLRSVPNHHHLTAETKVAAESALIAAGMIVRDEEEDFEAETFEDDGWCGVRVRASTGAGEIKVRLSLSDAPRLAGSWRPIAGDEETLEV